MLWVRWAVLRAVGLVYVLAFAGILVEGRALIAPGGIAPVADLLERMSRAFPHGPRPFVLVPSLFWLASGKAMVVGLGWAGLVAALALVLNLWPRMALFACWLLFLSFVAGWGVFSPAQLDDLMLEAALVCIPFAPPGLRPGLGSAAPPRPVAVFLVRWLLLRVMAESGLIKLIAGDPRWRDFTAMDIMHQMAPFPTILGYWDQQLPHAWHVLEVAFTFVAEVAAPIAAVFGGRRGRWFAFLVWTVFQAGIELTSNFGWLNIAAMAFGLLLLDDRIIAAAASRILRRDLAPPACARTAVSPWRLHGLRAAVAGHTLLTLLYLVVFFRIALGLPLDRLPGIVMGPVNLFWNVHSANEYNLYPRVGEVHHCVEFAGSNDGGRTWRAYPYRFVPQDERQAGRFFAPWFPRFETTLQNLDYGESKKDLFQTVAAALVAGSPEVTGLFASNPFPDRPPSAVRIRLYRLRFTTPGERRSLGTYWIKSYREDLFPMVGAAKDGRIVECGLEPVEAALRDGNPSAALEVCKALYGRGSGEAGVRLAMLYEQGIGLEASPERAVAIYRQLANRGLPSAQAHLGACYDAGTGVAPDPSLAASWYATAASHGSAPGLYGLGGLYARGWNGPGGDAEGLRLVIEARMRAAGADPDSLRVRRDESGYEAQLSARLGSDDLASARREAARRVSADDPLGRGT